MLNSSVIDKLGSRRLRDERLGAMGVVGLVILFAICAWLAQTTTLNHDSGWYLQATRIWIDGGKLYQDIIEINPPLAFAIHVPAVLLAELFGASSITIFFLWLFALIGISLVLCHRVVARLPLTATERTGLLGAALIALILGSWHGLGQREHFLMIFVLPYLFAAIARATIVEIDRPMALTIGGLAAFGFGLKPHFLLVPLAIEAYLFLARRKATTLLRPETAALALLLGAYLLAVLVFTPLYFTRIVPWGLTVYDALSVPMVKLLVRPETVLLPLAVCLYMLVRRPGVLRVVAEVFLLTAVCFWLVYLVQMKGFPYHRFPVRTALFVGLGACLLAALPTPLHPTGELGKPRGNMPFIAVGLVLVAMVGWLVNTGSYKNLFFAAGGRAVMTEQAKSGAKTLYVFSSNVWQAFPPANYTGLRTVSRFPHQWLLPGIVRMQGSGQPIPATERSRIEEIRRFITTSVVGDFRRGRPDLVLVDVRRRKYYFAGINFDYLRYFSKDARFAAIWSHYNKVGTVAGFDLYRRRR